MPESKRDTDTANNMCNNNVVHRRADVSRIQTVFVTGKTAQHYIENGLKEHQNLIQGIGDVRLLEATKRLNAEQRLAAFVGNTELGEFTIRGVTRLAYLQNIGAKNPEALRIHWGDVRRVIQIEDTKTKKPITLDVGYMIGYSHVIPMTFDAYEQSIKHSVYGYIQKRKTIEPDQKYVSAVDEMPGNILFDEVITFPFPKCSGDVWSPSLEIEGEKTSITSSYTVFSNLFFHVDKFIDRVFRFIVEPGQSVDIDSLPRLICYLVEGSEGAKLAETIGFHFAKIFKGHGGVRYWRAELDLKSIYSDNDFLTTRHKLNETFQSFSRIISKRRMRAVVRHDQGNIDSDHKTGDKGAVKSDGKEPEDRHNTLGELCHPVLQGSEQFFEEHFERIASLAEGDPKLEASAIEGAQKLIDRFRRNDTRRIYGVKEAMEIIGRSRHRLYQLHEEKGLGEYIGDRLLFSMKELLDEVENRIPAGHPKSDSTTSSTNSRSPRQAS